MKTRNSIKSVHHWNTKTAKNINVCSFKSAPLVPDKKIFDSLKWGLIFLWSPELGLHCFRLLPPAPIT